MTIDNSTSQIVRQTISSGVEDSLYIVRARAIGTDIATAQPVLSLDPDVAVAMAKHILTCFAGRQRCPCEMGQTFVDRERSWRVNHG